jgi:hypothetical protein
MVVFAFLSALCMASPRPVAAQCAPDPGSQIANGGFSGASCWTLHDPQQLVTTAYFSDSFYADIAGGGDYTAVQILQNISVQADVEYQFSCLIGGNPEGATVTFALQRNDEPWDTYGLWEIIPLQPGSTRFIVRFICTETDASARFTVFLGAVNGSVWLDDVRFENISCSQNDLIVNPTFDCEPQYPVGWNVVANDPLTSFATDSDAFHGSYSARLSGLPGLAYYDAVVDQQFIRWTANRFYLLRFWAKGTDAAHPFIVSMKDDETGETPVWLSHSLTPDWAPYPFVFRPTGTTSAAHLQIMAGACTGDAWFDATQFVEIPMPDLNSGGKTFYADVTGDGKADCIYAEMRDRWYVWVAESLGDRYAPFEEWCGPSAPPTAIPVIGNWNGIDADSLRRADLAWVDPPSGLIIVRLSDGSRFVDPGTNPWYQGSMPVVSVLQSGDTDGDGDDDIVDFTRGALADVYVFRAMGDRFGSPEKWNDWFAKDVELPFTGDFNDDGKFDIATFVRKNEGYVYVALSNGNSFGTGQMWAGLSCIHDERPAVGDLNGDGRYDIGWYVHSDTNRRVYARLCTGSGFGPTTLWHEYLVGSTDDGSFADLTGDGLADAVAMNTVSYSIMSARSWGGNFGDGLWWWTTDTIPYIPLPEEPTTGVWEPEGRLPAQPFAIMVSPQPVRAQSSVRFSLPHEGFVSASIYDIAGREVTRLAHGSHKAGEHEIVWVPRGCAAGVYFLRVAAPYGVASHKIILVR